MVKHLRYFKKLASDCAFDLRLQSLRPREWSSLPPVTESRWGGEVDFNEDFLCWKRSLSGLSVLQRAETDSSIPVGRNCQVFLEGLKARDPA